MPRVDTQSPPQTVFIKQRRPTTKCCRYLSLIAITTTFFTAFFVIKNPTKSLDTIHKYTAKTIPDTYHSPESIDPEDRAVFEGFKTSFLPAEEIILAKRNSKAKREVYEGDITSDFLIWSGLKERRSHPARIKRRSYYSFMSQDYDDPGSSNHEREIDNDDVSDDEDEANVNDDEQFDDSEEDYDYTEESIRPQRENNDQSEDDLGDDDLGDDEAEEKRIRPGDKDDEDREEKKSFPPPESHVDQGPFDDVVEQIRGQPELEEGEMGSSVNVYKPARSYTAIHAFWKGQGDRETIRSTQANIMRQYMDPDANPCLDFYQYACGNWPALNPIPADKAGYDTFEMLRENLDTVLKDLLEFKHHEDVPCNFPGQHLDLDDDFLRNHIMAIQPRVEIDDFNVRDTLCQIEAELKNKTAAHRMKYGLNTKTHNISDVVSRPRRYSEMKAEKTTQLLPTLKKRKNKHQNLNSKLQHKRSQRESLHKYPKKLSEKKKRFLNNKSRQHGRKLLVFNRKVGKRKETGIFRKLLHETSAIFSNKQNHTIKTNDAALKARYLFKSCMNYQILETRGHQPLLDLLDLLGGWPILNPYWNSSKFDWLETMARLRLYNNDILISEWVGPDIKNSDEFVIQFDQTSLGLPTRDYFLQSSNKIYLEAYKKYLLTIAILLGGDVEHVRRSAHKLINFEISLAKITSAPEDRRNVSELYRRMPLKKLEALVPEVKWRRYLCVVMNRTVQPNETVVLFALSYVRNLVELIHNTEPEVLANYLLWRFVRHRVNNLDDRFQSAKQQFYYILFGREQAPPRWKNCISQVNSNMGMALGSMFVRKYFDETSKNDTLTMTREIQQSFRELLHMTDWIDADTKKLAAHKVDAMMLRIGYPDFILNKEELDDRYKEVIIHPDKYFENILNILQHLTKMEQSRLGQPVNKTLWNTAPAVVNAYYSRNKNQIMFPAGILQPPFYHRHFPRSLNYGGIGVVIGHEITHGFDDKGRLFDCNGNLHRWWSDSAIEAFHNRAQCLIDQYSKYVVPEVNISLDGVNTQGENIADNGGVKQAFRAYLRWLKKHGAEDETLPGLNHTHTQLFFLNFAQVWCGAMRPEAMRNKLKTAVHSPGRFRVIGTLSNSHDFAREFRCPPGSPMNPKRKCSVW